MLRYLVIGAGLMGRALAQDVPCKIFREELAARKIVVLKTALEEGPIR